MSAGEVTSQIDLYDSDVLTLERALHKVQEKQGKVVNLDAYQREVIERFAEYGFRVDVKVFETNQSGIYHFDIDIIDRVEPEPDFDFDRQVHEVVNDTLDLGEGGVIDTKKKETPGLWTPGNSRP